MRTRAGSAVQAPTGPLKPSAIPSRRPSSRRPHTLSTAVRPNAPSRTDAGRRPDPFRCAWRCNWGSGTHTGGRLPQVACLNRLARLLAAAHGGQVLLTEVVRYRMTARYPPQGRLKRPRRASLRDLTEPERSFSSSIRTPGRLPAAAHAGHASQQPSACNRPRFSVREDQVARVVDLLPR